MKEILEVYDLSGKFLEAKERSKFYSEIKEEFKKKGKISKQVKRVQILLMNSEGRVYLQKRSETKNENPGLYDKTVGGHVNKGINWDVAAIKECAEELGFPAAIVKTEEFEDAAKNIDLKVVGIFKKIDYVNNNKSTRITQKGEKFVSPYMSSFYIGYYDGTIRFADGESSGIEVFPLKKLKEEIETNPDKFTEDIKAMIKKYEKYIKPLK